MIKASVLPHNQFGLNNEMFQPDFTMKSQWQGNTHWMETNVVWKKNSERNGIELATYDLLPPETADVVVHVDLPEKRSDLEKYLSLKGPKHLLMLTESPLRPYYLNKDNHKSFDAILTYDRSMADGKRYFYNPLAKTTPPKDLQGKDWNNRKNLVLLNSNRYIGIKAEKTPLHYLKLLYNMRKNGWHFSIGDVINYDRNFLYEERRKLVRCAEKYFRGSLDVYGDGWNGNNRGWYYRMFPDAKPEMNKGLFKGEKIELFQNYRYVIAFENFRGKISYVSEKMFDAFYGGAVPIYLGEENITDYVPKKCFVDARDFKNYNELLRFVLNRDEKTWQEYRSHINIFLGSKKFNELLPERNAERITTVIKNLAGNGNLGA